MTMIQGGQLGVWCKTRYNRPLPSTTMTSARILQLLALIFIAGGLIGDNRGVMASESSDGETREESVAEESVNADDEKETSTKAPTEANPVSKTNGEGDAVEFTPLEMPKWVTVPPEGVESLVENAALRDSLESDYDTYDRGDSQKTLLSVKSEPLEMAADAAEDEDYEYESDDYDSEDYVSAEHDPEDSTMEAESLAGESLIPTAQTLLEGLLKLSNETVTAVDVAVHLIAAGAEVADGTLQEAMTGGSQVMGSVWSTMVEVVRMVGEVEHLLREDSSAKDVAAAGEKQSEVTEILRGVNEEVKPVYQAAVAALPLEPPPESVRNSIAIAAHVLAYIARKVAAILFLSVDVEDTISEIN